MKSNILRRIAMIHLLMMAVLSGALNASENQAPFSEIVSFGDSLSDTGNIFAVSGETYPPAPYYEGRASNGALWNEHLAESLRGHLLLENNYSYFGSETGYGNYNEGILDLPLVGFADQIDQYLNHDAKKRIGPRVLFMVGVGSNDFFSYMLKGGTFPLPTGVQNTVAGIERLLKRGGRHFVVLNVPDLGKTPAFAAYPLEARAQVSWLCNEYNKMLALALGELGIKYPFKLTIVDAFSVINRIIDSPGTFGMVNTDIPAIFGVDPSISLFWDGVHPTTAGHRVLADFAIEAMMETYTAPKGKPFSEDHWYAPASISGK